jgi:LuxR family transcriptional regulator, maltose regulon positive regulatory protein
MPEEAAIDGSGMFTTGFVSRPRLLARLSYGIGDRIVVVEAPSGSGKSSLVADWVTRSNSLPSAWVSLEPGRTTRKSFWFRLAEAFVESDLVGERGPLEDFFAGYIDAADMAGLAARVMKQGANGEFVVVVDDLHLAPPAAVADLRMLVTEVPTMRLVVTSRSSIAPTLTRALPGRARSVISADELAFTEAEFLAVAERTSKVLPYRTRRELFRATGGHALSSRVALASAAADFHGISFEGAAKVEAAPVERVSHGLVPIFATHADFTLAVRLSSFSWIDDAIVRVVGGDGDAVQRFVDVGVGEVDPADGRFYFHPRIRTGLSRVGSTDISALERAADSRRVAGIVASRGDPLEAIRLLIKAEDYAGVWPIIANWFSELITFRDVEVIVELGRVPSDAVHAHVGLGAALATFLSERETAPSERLRVLTAHALLAAETTRSDDAIGEFYLQLAVFAAFRAARRYTEAGSAGDSWLSSIEELGLDERRAAAGAIAAGMIQIIITSIILGQFKKALAIAVRLQHDARAGRRQHLEALRAYASAARGEMDLAERHLHQVDDAHVVSWGRAAPATGWHLARALLTLERGDPHEARVALAPLDQRLNYNEHWPMVLWVRALSRLASSESEEGLDELDRAIHDNAGRSASPFGRQLLAAIQSDLLMSVGLFRRARKTLAAQDQASVPIALSAARLAVHDHDLEGARLLLRPALHASAIGSRRLAEAHFLSALIAQTDEDMRDAARSYARGVAILDRHKLQTPLLTLPRDVERVICNSVGVDVWPNLPGDPFVSTFLRTPLTARELEVLHALDGSRSSSELAEVLGRSINTVKSQLSSIYRKLGTENRREALQEASRRGLI